LGGKERGYVWMNGHKRGEVGGGRNKGWKEKYRKGGVKGEGQGYGKDRKRGRGGKWGT
jgi:hypothetical protein